MFFPLMLLLQLLFSFLPYLMAPKLPCVSYLISPFSSFYLSFAPFYGVIYLFSCFFTYAPYLPYLFSLHCLFNHICFSLYLLLFSCLTSACNLHRLLSKFPSREFNLYGSEISKMNYQFCLPYKPYLIYPFYLRCLSEFLLICTPLS